MAAANIASLHEGGQLEAKRAKGGVPESVWETYSAFANTDGGLIILGAEEDQGGNITYVGVPNPEQLVKKFWDGVHNPSKVSANILTNDSVTIETIDGCAVICIQVPRANRNLKPIYICGDRDRGTYRRDGEGDYHCSPDEILAMIRDASNEPFDDAPLEEFTLEALSQDTINRYRAALTSVRPNHPWLNLEDEEFLVKLNAIKRVNGEGALHPTRAGLLMFGFEHEILQEYGNYFLDYREIGAGSRWEDRVTSQDGTWTGNVFDFWNEALPRLTAALKRPFVLGTNLQRIEDTDMHAAIREAFANALIHADYYGRRGIVILRHAERIEVANPGTSRVALDVVRAGGISDARNPTLMRMFGLISACERTGSGFDIMKSAAAAAEALPPEITERYNPDRVEVTLHLGRVAALYPGENFFPSESLFPGANCSFFPSHQGGGGTRGNDDRTQPRPNIDAMPKALPYELAKIAEMACDKGSFTRKDVEAVLECGPTKAKGLIGQLLNRDIIAVEGSARGIRYRLR